MTGYCVIGERICKNGSKTEIKTELILKLKWHALHSIIESTPKDFNWKDKEIAKIFSSKLACNKLYNKVVESEFAKLFEKIYIGQIELTEEKIIKIV